MAPKHCTRHNGQNQVWACKPQRQRNLEKQVRWGEERGPGQGGLAVRLQVQLHAGASGPRQERANAEDETYDRTVEFAHSVLLISATISTCDSIAPRHSGQPSGRHALGVQPTISGRSRTVMIVVSM